jgi:anti-sigma B factor antagonist
VNTADVPDRLFLDCRLDSDVAVVKVTGEVDVSTSSSLRDRLLRVIADENRHGLVVNLASVSFLDSTGVGVLVGIWHRVCATRGRLALAAPSRQARRVLETTGLSQVLPIYDTEAAAVQACRKPTTR